ncbi:5-formyltetrahydrofolate cyclo-ligase [Chloroherpeton thalassium ATCC 35110]|uniref:5-formyltetrahydrofolate cyclo-ligase n=1 Tax=Chloroherpeton thalassium (strain ATCC 35110 / GB-78) TaxID=517418 RepID=B3QY84_CHLT3|nr:5-formyltetrahydrofolate cyclo-ligase [Chloroherpeton thalassium]ACF15050.1 5-formyltetrahydrofolate cyclo-ligase [Chloroherpeton thalassium ATCC 35110]
MNWNEAFQARNQIRAHLKEKRKQLTTEQWRKKSEKVFENLKLSQELVAAKTVHCYISSEKNREVDTTAIVNWLIEHQKKVLVPFVAGNDMYASEFDTNTKLTDGQFGIQEPIGAMQADESALSLVLMPLLAVDRKGNRLGYGKGFYDRFLVRLKKNHISPLKIGIAFDFQVIEALPTVLLENHDDVPLDAVITDTDRITFNALV